MTWAQVGHALDPREWLKIDPDVNTTALKATWSVRLWVGTFCIWALASVLIVARKLDPPSVLLELFVAWLGGLCGFSGFSYAQYRTQRLSNYGALDRQAAIAAAKVSGTVPPTGTTTETPTP